MSGATMQRPVRRPAQRPAAARVQQPVRQPVPPSGRRAAAASMPLVQGATALRARPAEAPEPKPRHVEIVATRAQRRARPKVVHAVVTLVSLFVIFAGQLLLSIAVSDGAYQIAALQQSQKELARTENALAEQLDALNSPQNLVANAAALGMVISTDAQYLRLADGAVFQAPPLQIRYGCATMCGLVGNELTKGMTVVTPPSPGTTATAGQATGQGTAQGATQGAAQNTTQSPTTQNPTTQNPVQTGPTTDQLPAPVTR